MKKKLSIFIYSLGAGGAEKVVATILPSLLEEFEVYLVIMNDNISYNLNGFNNIYYLEKSHPDESGILKLLKLPYLAYKYKIFCKKNNIDTSLSFLVRPNFIATLSKLFRNQARIIVSEHSLPSKQYSYNNFQSRINKYLIRKLYNLSDDIIAVSKGVSNDLHKHFNVSRNITTIYNPVNLLEIEKKLNEKVEFNFDKFTFITVGRLDDGKNHELMINAFANLQELDTQLIIIGEGSLREKLENLITQLNLNERVFLLGQQKNPYKYMNKADCFLLTSKYESFGIVLVEALCCSMPIISTSCETGPKEILKTASSTYGLLVDNYSTKQLTEAMESFVNDNNLLNLYKQAAKRRSYDFDTFISVNKYLKLLTSVER